MKLKKLHFAVIGLLSVLVQLGCSSDPTSGSVTDKDYPFYFVTDQNTFYRYHPLTKKVDTLAIPYTVSLSLTVSADGKRLYLPNANSTVVLSTDSLSFITELPYPSRGGIAVSPDGKLIAVQGRNLRILSTTDYSVVYSDTIGGGKGVFSHDSKTYYGLGGGVVFRLDPYTGIKGINKSFSPHTIKSVVPSHDERKLLLSDNMQLCSGHFLVYDVPADSMIFDLGIIPGPNRIVITPDGRYAFVTVPADLGNLCSGPSWFLMFDVEQNVVHKKVNTKVLVPDSLKEYLPVNAMAVSPDGKTLVLCVDWGRGEFVVFDVPSERFVGYDSVPPRPLMWTSCQNVR